MRLKNPKFNDPYGQVIRDNAPAINTYLNTRAADEFIDFDDLRANVPALAAIDDGRIAQYAQDAGIEVIS